MRGKGQPHPAPVAAGGLDADYPRAQLGDEGATEGAVDDCTQVEERDALQGALRHTPSSPVGACLDPVPQAGQDFVGMLSQRRSLSLRAARCCAHVHHGAESARGADSWNVQIADVAVVDDLGMVQSLLRGQIRLGGCVALPAEEYGNPLVQGLLLDFLQHNPLQNLHPLSVKIGSVLQLRVLVDEVHVQRVHHGAEQPLHHIAQLNPLAVARAGWQVAGGVAAPGADAGVGRVLVRAIPHHLAVHPGYVVVCGDGLDHAGFDTLAQAGLFPQVEGRRNAPHQGGGGSVADALGDHVIGPRPGVLVGEHHHPPTLGRHNCVVPLVVGVGAAGAEAGQGGVDQAGMAGAKSVVVNAQPLGDAGTVVLDNHVGLLRQGAGLFLAVRCLEVEDYALFAAVPLDCSGRVPELFAAGRFDLDDLGAEVRHHHGSDAARPAAGEIENRDSIEDLCHSAPLSVIWKIDANVPNRKRQCPGP